MIPASIAAVAGLAGLASLAGTYGLIRLDARLGLRASPRADRWHLRATPNSGGVAIFLSCALVYMLAFRGMYSRVALCAAAIFVLGFLDDRFRLRPILKLAAQCAIAAFLIQGGTIFHATAWAPINYAFSFLWIVGITNAFNLIDNMDGLSAGVVVIICAFRIAILSTTGSWTDAALAAAVGAAFAGFLVFNYNPARIFMGDCGSMFAGFSLAALMIASPEAHTKTFAAGFFYPALTFTYPIFDTVLVSFLRRAAGRPISVGGRDHSSHRLAYLGLGDRKVVWILWGLTAVGSATGLMTRWLPLEVAALAAVLVASLCMFGIFLSTLPPYQIPENSPILRSPLRRRVPTLRAAVILAVDALLAGLALFSAFLILYGHQTTLDDPTLLLVAVPVAAICQALASCVNRTFDVPWQWFAARDTPQLAKSILLASVLLWALMFVLRLPVRIELVFIHAGLWFILSAGLRGSLRALNWVFGSVQKETHKLQNGCLGAAAESSAEPATGL
jgi:UDP-GlcNAc:undecaprenyl-phosphate GlcNAc-1-phosphate transferase